MQGFREQRPGSKDITLALVLVEMRYREMQEKK